MTFSTLDFVILGLTLIGALWGAIKGFIDELADKFGYVVGLAAALMFATVLSSIFMEYISMPQWLASFLSYVVLFFAGFLVMKIFGKILSAIFSRAHLKGLDAFLGFVLGAAEMFIILGFFETILLSQNLIDISSLVSESFISTDYLLPIFAKAKDWLQSLV